MAVHKRKMVRSQDSSSSSDEEEMKRCQEAVWEARTSRREDGDEVKQSKRVAVADREHNGGKLQVTQGFQTHVTKKLVQFLDSHISENQSETPASVQSAEDDENEGGFRLFSTSVPGQTVNDPPTPVCRRPAPSSSDSDSELEKRVREAAVSVSDLLPSVPPTSALATNLDEPPSKKKKKKKKKKMADAEKSQSVQTKRKPEESKQQECPGPATGQNTDSDQEGSKAKVKRKKKKRQEGNTVEVLN